MKKLITIFIGLVTYNLAQGQISWGDYSQSYLREVIKQKNGIGVIAAIRMENNSFWVDNVNGKLMKSLSVDSVFMHSRHKDFIAINSFDSASAHFFCYGIDPGNAIDFEYRVLKNDKEMLMDWSPIKEFTADSVQELSGMPEMAYLGAFKVPVGSFEVVDIRNRISGKIVATGVVAWQKIKPLISDIYTSNELNAFITRLSRPWKYNRQTMTIDKWRKRYQVDQLDSATGLPRKLYLEHNENNLIFFLNADIYKESQVEYQLSEGQKVVRSWGINEFDNI
ncbi:MAG TPA: hypothetical protein PLR74_01645, partial [Agriterribacter sp.]|nr:hypothetical protein [Agriterribacter sp.]